MRARRTLRPTAEHSFNGIRCNGTNGVASSLFQEAPRRGLDPTWPTSLVELLSIESNV